MSETVRARAGLGLPSFLAIVSVLALTVLGVLTLSYARADAALQARHEELSVAYYEAAAQAQQTLAQLDEAMAEAFIQSTDEADYAWACARIKRVGETKIRWMDETYAVFYTDAGYGRQLCVEIKRNPFETAETARLTIVRHALEDTMEWEEDEPISLIA